MASLKFSIFLLLLPTLSLSVPCPFDQQPNGNHCNCTGSDQSGTSFRRAKCEVAFHSWSPLNAGAISSSSITDELSLTFLDYSPIPADSFTSLKYINKLVLVNTHADAVGLTLDPQAFVGTEVESFSARFFSFMLPPTQALQSLGQNGLKSLSFFDGNPIDLKANDFANFKSLQSLVLDNMQIQSINQSAFTGLEPTLTSLSLTNAKIYSFPLYALYRLTKLEFLDLSDNVMQEFPAQAFDDFKNLKELRLAGNIIQSAIQAGAFLQFPPTVEVLDLSRTFLQAIPTILLAQIPYVGNLNLANNLFMSVQKGNFPENINLTVLDLSQNPIEYIEDGAFQGLVKLQKLEIQDTMLATLDLGVFNGLDQLQRLELGYNSRWRNLTVDPPFKLPLSVNTIILVNSSLSTLDQSLESVISRVNFQTMDISYSSDLICDSRIHWVAKYTFCQPQRIVINGARCGNFEGILLNTYLYEMVKSPCK